MELSLEASRYSLGYAAFGAAYLGSYELLFASVYSAPLVGPIALVPPGAATSPVMLGPTSQVRFRLVATHYTQLTILERSMARITELLTTMVKTVDPMCRKHLALMHQN